MRKGKHNPLNRRKGPAERRAGKEIRAGKIFHTLPENTKKFAATGGVGGEKRSGKPRRKTDPKNRG